MLFPTISELAIIGVGDPGFPNQERVVLRPTEALNLGAYGLFLGVLQANGLVRPIPDQFFWFGDLVVTPPSWLIVYTGAGTRQLTRIPGTDQPAVTFHWGKAYTVFNTRGVVPVLFRFDGIGIGSTPTLGSTALLQKGRSL